MAAVAVDYAAAGWPVCLGTHLREERARHSLPGAPPRGQVHDPGRACSCDRIGCPAPGAHPISPAWQIEAASDPGEAGWWRERPEANIILVTGRVFDVLDVPAAAGTAALARMERAGVRTGPVALSPQAPPADDRALFFVATQGRPGGRGRVVVVSAGLRAGRLRAGRRPALAHQGQLRASPPRPATAGGTAHWIREPGEQPLPDALRLLEFLADACEEDSL